MLDNSAFIAPFVPEKVAGAFMRLVVETYTTKNYAGMKSLYNRACGITGPSKKLWLFDIDKVTEDTNRLAATFKEMGYLVARIPSKKAEHLITVPFDPRPFIGDTGDWLAYGEVSLHKDNPTNLYIPDGAD